MTTPTTDTELLTAYRELVGHLLSYDNPSSWPLSDESRIWFVRRFVSDAKTIAESEPFLRGAIVKALTEVQTLTGREPVCKARKTKR